jgi:hypothetical protein
MIAAAILIAVFGQIVHRWAVPRMNTVMPFFNEGATERRAQLRAAKALDLS